MAFRYKNISPVPQMIPNVGGFLPDEEFPSDVEINNANFKLINAESPQKPTKEGDSPTLPKSA